MKKLILIVTLLMSGCGTGSYTEQQLHDAFILCNANDGVEHVQVGWLFAIKILRVTCNNGAKFEL